MARTKIKVPQVDSEYIELAANSNITLTATAANFPFSIVSSSNGNSLSQSGSGVLIGAGVTAVRVSYTIMSDTGGTASYLFTRIRKNGSDVSQAIDNNTSQFRSTSETKVIPVAAGDLITIAGDSGGGSLVAGSSRQCHMLVEVVKN